MGYINTVFTAINSLIECQFTKTLDQEFILHLNVCFSAVKLTFEATEGRTVVSGIAFEVIEKLQPTIKLNAIIANSQII